MSTTKSQSITQRHEAEKFAERWQAMPGKEDEDCHLFWIELLQVIGVKNPTHVIQFERKIQGRKSDVFYEDMGILVEQKSRGVSLDEPSTRSKEAGPETPYEQALWYANHLPHSIRPRWLITCNFDEIRIYDQEHPEEAYTEIFLEDLPDQLYLLNFFTDKSGSRIVKEKELSIEAGEIVGKIYKAFAEQYQNIDTDKHEQRSLNILIVRMVFLLYAEDAGLLQEHQAFNKYMRSFKTEHMRQALIDLFKVLNTPEDKRDPYIDPALNAFPYINGGLFAHANIIIPQFTEDIRLALLLDASNQFDWKDISPTIFGAVFESTLNPETRRAGGMHYTSVENIHKVIDPLFLDDLKKELERIEALKTEYDRKIQLREFQNSLASIKILDPACGSGNFLTESYLSLRKLENRVIENLQIIKGNEGQLQFGFEGEANTVQVAINQFYGIEINDFAVSVAMTAMWIAEAQMARETQDLIQQKVSIIPLTSNANIHEGNALRMNWSKVLPAEECSFICGNPPFAGHQWRTVEQQEDMRVAFNGYHNYGKLDYVCAWYAKAADYVTSTPIRVAFVSTNSICQGESVRILWEPIFRKGFQINFAYPSFVWNNEASDQAHVHVVIVGFALKTFARQSKTIYYSSGAKQVSHINGYLVDAEDIFITSRGKPCNNGVPPMTKGSQPTDGGNLILTQQEANELLLKYPNLSDIIRPYMGGNEFINNKKRYCLWFVGARPSNYNYPEIRERLSAVKSFRKSSPTKSVQEAASKPALFTQIRQPDNNYLAIPEVSSERRKYIPVGFIDKQVIASNKLRFVPTDSLYIFGLLLSNAHMAWMRVVSGRLKSDYSYSPAVYNSFIFPATDETQQIQIAQLAKKVLEARSNYPETSLAEMYDPDNESIYPDLYAAHKALDQAVEEAYGVNFNNDEERIVAHLFKLYAELTDKVN